MGGICGFISKNKVHEKTINNMANEIEYRGIEHLDIIRYKNVCMAQRLFNIEAKATNVNIQINDFYICIDGEIYNSKILKEEMMSKGYKCTDNKTLIIALYNEYGIDFAKKINGIFAISLYDSINDKLILVRDKIGKKPLYYSTQNGDIVFASELKPIMKYDYFTKEIRTDIICRYLCTNYIQAPETIFKDTFKLENGSYIVWSNGNVTKGKYWSYIDKYKEKSTDKIYNFEEAKNGLKNLIYESVERRLINSNTGVYLSGGIDSSLVTAVASDISKNKINTFSIGFHDSKTDEAKFAKEVAKHIGTNHNELYVSEDEMTNTIFELPKYYDEPFADPSQIPSILVSRLAKDKVDLVLTGDGADQIFCGSNSYDRQIKAQRLDPIFNILYYICSNKIIDLQDNMPKEIAKYIYNKNKDTKSQFDFLRKEFDARKVVLGESLPVRYQFEKDIPIKNWQERRLMLDMQTFLSTRLLTKVDRASVNEQIELRMPLIDSNIIEYSFRIPHRYKYYKGEKKYILKQILYELVPKELLDRPKTGFGIPVSESRKKVIFDILSKFMDIDILKKQGIFDGRELQRILEEVKSKDSNIFFSILYPFLIFQLWYKEYIEDLWG